MLGLIGFLVLGGSFIKDGCNGQFVADWNKSRAKREGELYYRNISGECRLVETGEKVYIKYYGNNECIFDRYGRRICNVTEYETDRLQEKLKYEAQLKADKFKVKDRDWLYASKEFGAYKGCKSGKEELFDDSVRIDIKTGRVWVLRCDCGLAGITAYDDKKSAWHVFTQFHGIRDTAGTDFYEKHRSRKRLSFYKQYYRIRPDNTSYMAECEEITLGDYLYKYKGEIDDFLVDFLLKTGVLHSREIRYRIPYSEEANRHFYDKYSNWVNKVRPEKTIYPHTQIAMLACTEPSDIVGIDEERLREVMDICNTVKIENHYKGFYIPGEKNIPIYN